MRSQTFRHDLLSTTGAWQFRNQPEQACCPHHAATCPARGHPKHCCRLLPGPPSLSHPDACADRCARTDRCWQVPSSGRALQQCLQVCRGQMIHLLGLCQFSTSAHCKCLVLCSRRLVGQTLGHESLGGVPVSKVGLVAPIMQSLVWRKSSTAGEGSEHCWRILPKPLLVQISAACTSQSASPITRGLQARVQLVHSSIACTSAGDI